MGNSFIVKEDKLLISPDEETRFGFHTKLVLLSRTVHLTSFTSVKLQRDSIERLFAFEILGCELMKMQIYIKCP